jgi:hypothetical protein
LSYAKVRIDVLRQAFEDGKTVVLQMDPTNMHNMDGSLFRPWDEAQGGQGIVVRGISENGDLTISSWGKQFYVSANEFEEYAARSTNAEGAAGFLEFSTIVFP